MMSSDPGRGHFQEQGVFPVGNNKFRAWKIQSRLWGGERREKREERLTQGTALNKEYI